MSGGPGATGEPTPMFPLGSVLLPTMLLPLHVFEPRYRTLMADVLAGDRSFGVTMIERGSEVGGSDTRAAVGCRARILEAEEQADGRWHLVAVGAERFRVVEWLPDDPYPRALVEDLPDEGPDAEPDADPRWLELDGAFRSLLQLAHERLDPTGPSPADLALAEDPALFTFQMAAVAPLGPLDRYRVLAAPSAEARRLALIEAFADLRAVLDPAPPD